MLVLQYQGEESVVAAFPSATILRPADIFGDEDRLLNWIAEVSTSRVFFYPTGICSDNIAMCALPFTPPPLVAPFLHTLYLHLQNATQLPRSFLIEDGKVWLGANAMDSCLSA